MKNDLTAFEKDLLKVINFSNHTKYNYKHLMEWSSSKSQVKVKDGEILYKALGCYVVINPNN